MWLLGDRTTTAINVAISAGIIKDNSDESVFIFDPQRSVLEQFGDIKAAGTSPSPVCVIQFMEHQKNRPVHAVPSPFRGCCIY